MLVELHVTRVKPSVLQGSRGRLRVGPISAHHDVTSHNYIDGLSRRQRIPVLVDYSDFDICARDPAEPSLGSSVSSELQGRRPRVSSGR